ncbi:hypothetical protein PVAND_003374 [Polypedilum vanderplanki]|uniref:Uncharacterized protein n=1 Tax=Polypedilum vanderplanki TaxID=319348 RepID=A0A9J6BUB1_POLVA|nr:hypothetical protein PVAND_003374 [Polypedilum vanderplanki]
MKILLIFVIISHMSVINFAYVDLDTTTEIPIRFQKIPKNINFIKVDLNRDETLNEIDSITTTEQSTTKATDLILTKKMTTTPKAHLLNDHLNENFKDISTTEQISTTTTLNPSRQAKNNNTGNKTRWFFVGAAVGIVLSLIINYIYTFYKARSESSYHNL